MLLLIWLFQTDKQELLSIGTEKHKKAIELHKNLTENVNRHLFIKQKNLTKKSLNLNLYK